MKESKARNLLLKNTDNGPHQIQVGNQPMLLRFFFLNNTPN